MREAFSMFMAIVVIVLMATITILVFSMSGKMVKTTSIQYRKAQAELLAKSYTELAILSVIHHDRNTTGECIEKISGVVNGIDPGNPPVGSSLSGSGYDVVTRVYYLGNNLPCTPNKILNTTTIATDYNTTSPKRTDSVAGIIVDVFVRYKDPSMVDAYTTTNGSAPTETQIPWITYHRRTLQKI